MNLSNQEILAKMLISARNEKGYSQRQLSLLAGVSNTEISKLEKAERLKPQPTILKKISDVLDLDYEEMLEAIGYIDTSEFDDNRILLDESEKDFIVEAIVEKYAQNNQFLKTNLNDKNTVYNIIFSRNDSQKQLSKASKAVFEKIDLGRVPTTKKQQRMIK